MIAMIEMNVLDSAQVILVVKMSKQLGSFNQSSMRSPSQRFSVSDHYLKWIGKCTSWYYYYANWNIFHHLCLALERLNSWEVVFLLLSSIIGWRTCTSSHHKWKQTRFKHLKSYKGLLNESRFDRYYIN